MRDLQRATACAHALSSRTGAGAVAAATLHAIAFLRRHAAPDAAAAARLAAIGAGSGSRSGPACHTGGAQSVPSAVAAALEAAPELMAAAAAGDSGTSSGFETAAGHHAYGVASALVAAAQIRAAAALAAAERAGAGGAPGEGPVCCAQAFERLWPALGAATACRCAAPLSWGSTLTLASYELA